MGFDFYGEGKFTKITQKLNSLSRNLINNLLTLHIILHFSTNNLEWRNIGLKRKHTQLHIILGVSPVEADLHKAAPSRIRQVGMYHLDHFLVSGLAEHYQSTDSRYNFFLVRADDLKNISLTTITSFHAIPCRW